MHAHGSGSTVASTARSAARRVLPAAAAAAGVWLGWCCRCLVLSRFVPAVMHCPEGTPAELVGSARGPLRLALALVASRPSRL